MSRVATTAGVAAIGLVAAAGVVATLSDPAPTTSPTSLQATTSARRTTAPTTTPPTAAPPTTSVPTATTAPTVPRGPLEVADAEAALPLPDDAFGPADLEVQLGSVCEGAAFDLVGATAVYASLQSTSDPLRYLDATVVVYETEPTARTAYERIAAAIAECPPERTATPVPTATEQEPTAIAVRGEARGDVAVGGRPGVQWLQTQTSTDTELRTVITVTAVANAIVAISMDEDAETVDADGLAAASLTRAEAVAAALAAAAGG